MNTLANDQKGGADSSFQHRADTYYLEMNATFLDLWAAGAARQCELVYQRSLFC